MPIVFDNIVFNLQRAGGISRFWCKIIEPYNGSASVRYIERAGEESNLYRRGMSLAPRTADHALPLRLGRYVNFSRRFFQEPFVFHSSYFRVNKAPGCVNVTTVHDLIYEKFGTGLGSVLHLAQKRAALRRSDCIVCVSEHTRRDLLEHYPFCADIRIEVIPNGVDGFCPPAAGSAVPFLPALKETRSYFLYVGHRGGCKGFDLVYDALDFLKGSLCCVVVGAPFSQAESQEIAKRGHWHNILNVGKVSDSELNDLYGHADFFFFPSLYEGFGIPPLEAMMAGCPVLASNRSSVPEVVGEAGVLFDPADLQTLKNGLMRVLQKEARPDRVARGIERAWGFSWQSVVESYAALYTEVQQSL